MLAWFCDCCPRIIIVVLICLFTDVLVVFLPPMWILIAVSLTFSFLLRHHFSFVVLLPIRLSYLVFWFSLFRSGMPSLACRLCFVIHKRHFYSFIFCPFYIFDRLLLDVDDLRQSLLLCSVCNYMVWSQTRGVSTLLTNGPMLSALFFVAVFVPVMCLIGSLLTYLSIIFSFCCSCFFLFGFPAL